MLREHGKQLHRAWIALDAALAAAVFAGLLALPGLYVERGLTPLDLRSVAVLGFLVLFGWPLILTRGRVYAPNRREPLGQIVMRLAAGSGGLAVILATACYLLAVPLSRAFPFVLACALFVLQLLAQLAIRTALGRLRRAGQNFRNVLIVGAGPRASEAQQAILRHPEWGFRIRGFVDEGGAGFRPSVAADQIVKFADFPRRLRDDTIDEVLVACPRTMLSQIGPVVEACALVGIPVTLLTDLFGEVLPPPRIGEFESMRTLCFAPVHHNELHLLVKRSLDLLGGVAGLLVAAPLLAVAAASIRLTSPGPVIFRQTRLGLNGRPFEMVKLRTMVENAEDLQQSLSHLNEMDGPVFKIRSDPRVTPVGRILRKWSVDELPQFWNVLRGDMSLVGPRPPTPAEVIEYRDADRRRLSMRPGLTCLWQVSGRNQVAFEEWMKLDLQYIDGWSLGMDLRILLRTVPEVLLARGAS